VKDVRFIHSKLIQIHVLLGLPSEFGHFKILPSIKSRRAQQVPVSHMIADGGLGLFLILVCTENLNPNVVVMKSAKDRV